MSQNPEAFKNLLPYCPHVLPLCLALPHFSIPPWPAAALPPPLFLPSPDGVGFGNIDPGAILSLHGRQHGHQRQHHLGRQDHAVLRGGAGPVVRLGG